MNEKELITDYKEWKEAEKSLIKLIEKHIEECKMKNEKLFFKVLLSKIGYKNKKDQFVYAVGYSRKKAIIEIAHLIYFDDGITLI